MALSGSRTFRRQSVELLNMPVFLGDSDGETEVDLEVCERQKVQLTPGQFCALVRTQWAPKATTPLRPARENEVPSALPVVSAEVPVAGWVAAAEVGVVVASAGTAVWAGEGHSKGQRHQQPREPEREAEYAKNGTPLRAGGGARPASCVWRGVRRGVALGSHAWRRLLHPVRTARAGARNRNVIHRKLALRR